MSAQQFSLLLLFLGAIVGFGFWLVERRIGKIDKVREARETAAEETRAKHEADREQYQLFLIRGVCASMALSKATAIAVKEQRCNGEMTTALQYCNQLELEQREFLEKCGVHSLFRKDSYEAGN